MEFSQCLIFELFIYLFVYVSLMKSCRSRMLLGPRGRQARAELRPVRLPVTSPTLPHPRSRPAPSFLPSRARTLEAGNGSARLPPPGQTERPLGRGSARSRPPGRGSGAPPAGVEAHSVLPSFPIHPGSLGRKAPHTTSTHTSLLWRRAPEKPSLAAAFSAHTHGGKTRWLAGWLAGGGAASPRARGRRAGGRAGGPWDPDSPPCRAR